MKVLEKTISLHFPSPRGHLYSLAYGPFLAQSSKPAMVLSLSLILYVWFKLPSLHQSYLDPHLPLLGILLYQPTQVIQESLPSPVLKLITPAPPLYHARSLAFLPTFTVHIHIKVTSCVWQLCESLEVYALCPSACNHLTHGLWTIWLEFRKLLREKRSWLSEEQLATPWNLIWWLTRLIYPVRDMCLADSGALLWKKIMEAM